MQRDVRWCEVLRCEAMAGEAMMMTMMMMTMMVMMMRRCSNGIEFMLHVMKWYMFFINMICSTTLKGCSNAQHKSEHRLRRTTAHGLHPTCTLSGVRSDMHLIRVVLPSRCAPRLNEARPHKRLCTPKKRRTICQAKRRHSAHLLFLFLPRVGVFARRPTCALSPNSVCRCCCVPQVVLHLDFVFVRIDERQTAQVFSAKHEI